MKKQFYFCGKIDVNILKNHSSEKAFFISYDYNGFGKYRMLWIPKSICKFGDKPNEFGWISVCIPRWFFVKNNLEYARFDEIRWNCNDEPFQVEM